MVGRASARDQEKLTWLPVFRPGVGIVAWAVATILVLALCFLGAAAASDGPQPPCNGKGTAPIPSYSELGATPNVRVYAKGKAERWVPPACVGWGSSRRLRLIISLAGSFRHDGADEDLLTRFGAISALRGLRYWSVTDKTWRPLVTDAAALDGPDAIRRRPSFGPQEMKKSAELFFVQEDNRSEHPVVYRMRILERAADRFAIETENLSSVRGYLMTLFPPGTLLATYFVEQRAPGQWGFYGLLGIGEGASSFVDGHEASYVNRAVALYRHIIGLPSDGEPPLAP